MALLSGHLKPAAQVLEVKDPSQFFNQLDTLIAQQEYVLVVITATDYNAPDTTQTWCQYCDRARANIKSVLIPTATQNGEKLVYCTVSKEEWVGNAKHAYKADQRLRVRGVPTVLLVKRTEGGT